jgi:hypothetical protein
MIETNETSVAKDSGPRFYPSEDRFIVTTYKNLFPKATLVLLVSDRKVRKTNS